MILTKKHLSKPPQSLQMPQLKPASHPGTRFWSIFDRVLLPTWTLRTQFGTSGLTFHWFFRFSAKIDFGSDFDANLPPFSLPKSIKIASKIDLERHQNFDRFLHRLFIDFDSILGAKLEPSWPLKSHQSQPKCFPRRTWEPESAQTPSKPLFWSIFDGFGVDFWSMCDWFSIDFWLIFDRCSVEFELVSDRFYCFLPRFLIDSNIQSSHYFLLQRGGGYAALLRFVYIYIYICTSVGPHIFMCG